MNAISKLGAQKHLREFWQNYKFPLVFGVGWILLVIVLITISSFYWGSNRGIITTLTDWDGGWYISIARDGYQKPPYLAQANIAFFPLYPALISLVSLTGISYEVSAVLISWLCFLGALCILYAYVREKWSEAVAKKALCFIALNPASVFFAMAYTESLFLLLVLSSFMLVLKKRFFWAALLAGAASATRSVGAIISVVVLLSYVHHLFNKRQIGLLSALKTILVTVISLSGLLMFCSYLNVHANDPMAFSSVQQYWWRGSGAVGLIEEVRYYIDWISDRATLPLITFGFMWGAIPLAVGAIFYFLRKRNYGLAALVLGGVIIPLSTGTVTSLNRYILVLFPIFIWLALVAQKRRWLSVGLKTAGVACFVAIVFILTHPSHPFIG